jgi:hypothetical protein
MFGFILGCFYLVSALTFLWLNNRKFDLVGFFFNKANHKFYVGYELSFLVLCMFALLESMSWVFFILLAIHFMGFYIFYSMRNEIDALGQNSMINFSVIFYLLGGVFSLFTVLI